MWVGWLWVGWLCWEGGQLLNGWVTRLGVVGLFWWSH